MSELEVRIVNLEPMRVASVQGYSPQPEAAAWAKLTAWAGPKGYLQNQEKHRIFGFNNPSPSPGSPNYGYEFWIAVGPDVEPEPGLRVMDFRGGLYAVTYCKVGGEPYDSIPRTWQQLVRWLENSPYKHASHQWLEEHIKTEHMAEGEFDLYLYMPIRE